MTAFRESLPMAVAVTVIWLLLVGEINTGQVLLALLLGAFLPMIDHRLRPDHAHMHRPWVILRLTMVVLYDIVVANLHVAWLILGPESRLHSTLIWMPVDIRNPYGIAALTGIITSTPGTVSVKLSDDRRYLLLHCLDSTNTQQTIDHIKQRYERPLMEIFP